MSRLAIFMSGVVFAVGLALAGMTRPQKVIGFLDFFGSWDPSLMFVMVGAIGVNLVLLWLMLRRGKPVHAERFQIPTRTELDPRLIGGAALFGVGWGLGGYCPGPALSSLTTGSLSVLVFIVAMTVGMRTFDWVIAAGIPRKLIGDKAEDAPPKTAEEPRQDGPVIRRRSQARVGG